MEESQQNQSRMALEQQLVKELEAMRDVATNLSLTLHDLNFLIDVRKRAAARELASECFVRSQIDRQ